MTNSSVIDQFVQSVVYDHAVATGLKSCESHENIVDYAKSMGFVFTNTQWNDYVQDDWHDLSSLKIDEIRAIDVSHWSWAFRQVSSWRAMLMDGA